MEEIEIEPMTWEELEASLEALEEREGQTIH